MVIPIEPYLVHQLEQLRKLTGRARKPHRLREAFQDNPAATGKAVAEGALRHRIGTNDDESAPR